MCGHYDMSADQAEAFRILNPEAIPLEIEFSE